MVEHKCKIRVRYSETDQMGYVYYGNYAAYYEVARVEMLRNLGTTYKEMEESGTMMPVLELKCKYIRPARYDEELSITVKILEKPQTRIKFHYEIHNENEELINIGETALVFVNIEKNRPGLPSKEFEELMGPYFKN